MLAGGLDVTMGKRLEGVGVALIFSGASFMHPRPIVAQNDLLPRHFQLLKSQGVRFMSVGGNKAEIR